MEKELAWTRLGGELVVGWWELGSGKLRELEGELELACTS